MSTEQILSIAGAILGYAVGMGFLTLWLTDRKETRTCYNCQGRKYFHTATRKVPCHLCKGVGRIPKP